MSTTPDPTTRQALARGIAAMAHHTALLVEDIQGVTDLEHPSLCEGWTRGHVLTHVARNAEAIVRLIDWAVDGTPRQMYPGGGSARDAAIEAGARRSVQECVDDVVRTAEALAGRIGALRGPWAVDGVEMRGGLVVSPARLPFLRLRELVFHHVDLDAGFTFADVEEDLLREFVGDAVQRLSTDPRAPAVEVRTTTGDVWRLGEPASPVTGDLAGVLLWLARRRPDGVQTRDAALPELPRGA